MTSRFALFRRALPVAALSLCFAALGCADDDDLDDTPGETPAGDTDPETPEETSAVGTPGINVTPTTGLKTSEAGLTASFTIALKSKPTADVTIALKSSNEAEGTIDKKSVVFTADNWESPQTITITGVDDLTPDGPQSYTIQTAAAVSSDAAYNGLDGDDVAVTNADNDSAGITVTPIAGLKTTEAGEEATFTVKLNTKPTADVTIALTSSNDKEGVVSPASLVFTTLNWNAPQTVTVTGVDDTAADGAQTYKIVTAPAKSTDKAYDGVDADDVTIVNVDDESPGITVKPTTGLVTTESGGTATFTVRLNSKPSADVTIPLSSSSTTEGTVGSSSLVFTADNWNAPQTVTVTGVDDSAADGDKTYKIVLGTATSTDTTYNGLDGDDVSVTNTDDESAGFTVTPTTGLTTTEGGGSATFTIRLNSKPSGDVTVGLTSSNDKEGTVSPASVTFTADNWNAPRTVTVTGVDDSTADGNQPFKIITGVATGTDTSGYVGLNPADVSLTNIDNDTPGFTVVAVPGSVSESGGTTTFSIKLNSQPTGTVVIPVASLDTTEGTVSVSTINFDAASWSTPYYVTVTGVDDFVADGNQAFTIQLGVATGTDTSGYVGLNAPDLSVTNTDNDSPGITVTPTTGLTTSEAGGAAKFSVKLNSQPTADVTIPLTVSSAEGSLGTVTSVKFTATDWNTAQTVVVTGKDDSVADGDQLYYVRTGAATSTDTGYNGLNAADVELTNTDNDAAGIIVTPTSGLITTEAGGIATFTVVLTSAPTSAVSIVVSSSNKAEGYPDVTSLLFDSTDWSKPKTVTVKGADDVIDDGDIGYSIILDPAISKDTKYNGINPTDVSVTNTDDDIDCTITACGATCLDVLKVNPKYPSGNYKLLPAGVKAPITVYCADMEVGKPSEYLNVNQKVNYSHFSSASSKCQAACGDYTMYYAKLRFNPATLAISTRDQRFATGSGGTADCYKTYGCSGYILNYGSAGSCSTAQGVSSIDLSPNPFSFGGKPQTGGAGNTPAGTLKWSTADYKSGLIYGNGYCGNWGFSDGSGTNPVGSTMTLTYYP
jgi:hypothetical protein